jgi:hypothetical protein
MSGYIGRLHRPQIYALTYDSWAYGLDNLSQGMMKAPPGNLVKVNKSPSGPYPQDRRLLSSFDPNPSTPSECRRVSVTLWESKE